MPLAQVAAQVVQVVSAMVVQAAVWYVPLSQLEQVEQMVSWLAVQAAARYWLDVHDEQATQAPLLR